ncbi:hypothetical protein HKX17_12635 [Sulfitobacter sp. KE34]|uniref:Tat pathway signal sequence domain protein n=1 Tax=Sulfitobacter faviae TaxID=1775881 RepID=A0AAX3LR00_9RHOB|nr:MULTISPECIES: hypothetical protein [Sulfitobacter]MDF3351001.1 hypothetical protein [Sulfitobacter sp. KE12]MDF3354673.1 hypothetical protein [Sulfitobacter sp. KE27]MDF3358321.1 hypothetical protein [Sulfitobacter sp. KE33]MDF3361133.1 hypothetical protein [Sulfitobacter sp. Ks41]MDF3365745.1 hypothetical protein [Sulfitobacter sp. Ks34]
MPHFRSAFLAALSLTIAEGAAAETPAATPASASPALKVELNAADTTEANCKLTFLITNELSAPLDKAVYETVLFDREGTVNRLTLFDFGELPVGRPRVRQFVVPQITCENLGRILFNGAQSCDGAGIEAGTCESALAPATRTEIEVLG